MNSLQITPFVLLLWLLLAFSIIMFLWELALFLPIRWRIFRGGNRRRKWFFKWVPWLPGTAWWFGVSVMALPQDVIVEANIKRRSMWLGVGVGIGTLFIERRGEVVA